MDMHCLTGMAHASEVSDSGDLLLKVEFAQCKFVVVVAETLSMCEVELA